MAKVVLTKSDTRRALRLPHTADVDELVRRRILEIAGHTRRGQLLFDADDVRRVAIRILDDAITRESPRSA